MKKAFLLLITLCFVGAAAQAQYKGKPNKAESNLAKGEYADAKGEIDLAIQDEKYAEKSDTWFTRGKVYQAIATSNNPSISGLDDNALEKATESYQKAMEMEKEGSPTYYLAQQNIDDLWGTFINAGGDAYSNGDYQTAYDQFIIAQRVKPGDSLTVYYTAAAAQQLGNFQDALDQYYTMVDNGDAGVDVYSTIAYLERAEMNNNEAALKIVRAAKELYPEDDKFAKEEINLLIAMEQVDEAREKLEAEIAKDPDNISLHLNLGIMYDNLGTSYMTDGKVDEAQEAYRKAIKSYAAAQEIESDNFISVYNQGAVYVNLGKVFLDKAREMDLKTYEKEGPALIEKAQVELKQALPFLEKAYELEPEDTDVIRALYQVYQQLKMNDKANEMYEKLEALEG